MLKKLAVLGVMLTVFLGMAAPSIAMAQEEGAGESQYGPTPGVDCNPQVGQQVAPQEEVTELPAAANPRSLTPGPEGGDAVDESFTITDSGGNGNQCTDTTGGMDQETNSSDPACARCTDAILTAAQEAIMGGDTGPSPTETFGAALQAARDAGSSATRDAAASETGEGPEGEETQQSPTPVEDTSAYQAAFEAAKEAGADEETAKETAKQAVADLLPDEAVAETVGSASGESSTGEASKTSEGGSGEGSSATEGKTSKGDASKGDASKDDASEDRASKDKPRKDDASEEEATDEEATEDTDEEIVASGEDGGSGDTPTTPAESKAPLLLGGVALLSVGGFAGLRLARSWPSSSARGSRLLRD